MQTRLGAESQERLLTDKKNLTKKKHQDIFYGWANSIQEETIKEATKVME